MHSKITFDEYTRTIFDKIYNANPIESDLDVDSEDETNVVLEGINLALEVDSHSLFLEGLSERLTNLGTPCSNDDTKLMLSEVKRRYDEILGVKCPRTVQEWVKGTTPGITNRSNNYDLCYALEMDFRETCIFFQKHFLTLPFNAKSRVDAVYLYALYHNKPYSVVADLKEKVGEFEVQEVAHTNTSQIYSQIIQIDDDQKFVDYISRHCYDEKQQFQKARDIIRNEVDEVRKMINMDAHDSGEAANRLMSRTIDSLLGYSYQKKENRNRVKMLPRRFTESIPNDVTLGQILNDEKASYDTIRKSMMILRFYNFFYGAENYEEKYIKQNLMDFKGELDTVLGSCGFATVYVCHPFDCLLLYCANSYDPIEAFHFVMRS